MATATLKQLKTEIIYPDSDGKPMADNTIQADAMTIIRPFLTFEELERLADLEHLWAEQAQR